MSEISYFEQNNNFSQQFSHFDPLLMPAIRYNFRKTKCTASETTPKIFAFTLFLKQ